MGARERVVWAALRCLATGAERSPCDPHFDPAVHLADDPMLVEAVAEQRMASMLVWVLEGRNREVPAELVEDHQSARFIHAASLHRLSQIDEALTSQGIPWLAVKGAVLASMYPVASTRPFLDIDLLVPGRDLEPTIDALDPIGIVDVNRNWENYVRYEVAETPLWAPGVAVDLHWNLIGLGEHRRTITLVTDAMIERRRMVDVAGLMVPTLDPVDLLLHVCIHAGLSGGSRLQWLRDVREVANADTIDWDEFVDRARATGVAAMVGQVLDRARELVQAPVPPAVASTLCSQALLSLRRAADRVGRGRLLPDYFASGSPVALTGDTVGAVADRCRYLWRRRHGDDLGWNVGDPDGVLYWGLDTGGPEARAEYFEIARGSGAG